MARDADCSAEVSGAVVLQGAVGDVKARSAFGVDCSATCRTVVQEGRITDPDAAIGSADRTTFRADITREMCREDAHRAAIDTQRGGSIGVECAVLEGKNSAAHRDGGGILYKRERSSTQLMRGVRSRHACATRRQYCSRVEDDVAQGERRSTGQDLKDRMIALRPDDRPVLPQKPQDARAAACFKHSRAHAAIGARAHIMDAAQKNDLDRCTIGVQHRP
jgi:hypothetical protein